MEVKPGEHYGTWSEIPCPRCSGPGTGPDASTGVNYWCDRCRAWFARCETCAKTYAAPQSPYCKDGHQAASPYHVFTPYFDDGLGVEVTSLAQRWRLMHGETDCDGTEHAPRLEYRDKMSPGDLSARRDRLHEQRKEQSRG